jgi:predicted HTH domain antitoxin
MQVTVELPDSVARQLGSDPSRVARHVVEDVALEGYRAGRLSQRQVARLLGLDYWRAEHFLRERGVPLNYSVTDLEADAAALHDILPRR